MAASRFIRFFSRRQAKNPEVILNNDNHHHHSKTKFLSNGKPQHIIPVKNGPVCTVIFLDGEDVNFEVDVS
jgi:hypothetical protein